MENQESVINYDLKQISLKRKIAELKKKIPYFIFGFVFFGIGLFLLLDGRLNDFIGNSYNLILVLSILYIIISLIYLVFMYIKINRIKAKIKVLGEKMHNKMKLKDLKDE